MQREDAVLVVRELSELGDVVPDLLVGGVEQVGTVLVDLDAGLRLCLRVCVSPQVVTAIQHQHALTQLGSGTLGDGQPEESRTDDDQVVLGTGGL